MLINKFKIFLKSLFLSLSLLFLIGNSLAGATASSDLQSILYGTAYYDPSLSSCSTTEGSFPSGLDFPTLDPTSMATAINTYIKQNYPTSLMNGLGQTIVADGSHSNVNPFLIVAIAQHESTMASPTDFNIIHAGNPFGRTAVAGQPSYQGSKLWYYWSSVEASVDYTAPENQKNPSGDFASYMRAVYGQSLDSNTLTPLIDTYAPASDGNNPTSYVAALQATAQSLIALTAGATTQAPTNQSTVPTCSIGSTSCATSQSQILGTAAILCEAEKYEGIYYNYGSGHGYASFRAGCPEASIPSAIAASSINNPGPCATDCSGLVSVAVDAVYNQDFSWAVSTTNGTMIDSPSNYWQSIPINQVAAGDIVTHYGNGDGHVEIVNYVSGDTLYTIGSFQTGTKTGTDTSSISGGFWNGGAWRYVGPGATS